jgi:hypothetical protein
VQVQLLRRAVASCAMCDAVGKHDECHGTSWLQASGESWPSQLHREQIKAFGHCRWIVLASMVGGPNTPHQVPRSIMCATPLRHTALDHEVIETIVPSGSSGTLDST